MKPPVILVVASHPDDEVLGCGATIARHADQGAEVDIVILGEGVSSRRLDEAEASRAAAERADEAREAARRLGAHSLTLHGLPDNRLDQESALEIARLIEDHIAAKQPRIVYTHHSSDVNVDHRVTHEAVVTACRPRPGLSVRVLLFFEVASSTEWQPPRSGIVFHPELFVDAGPYLARKLDALSAYRSELRDWPHPRGLKAVEHLARWRGATVGCEAAEAFMLGREIRQFGLCDS